MAITSNTDKGNVYTGVCIIRKEADGSTKIISFAEGTRVTVYPMTAEEIECYVDSGEPMDKAGAYGIQDGGLVAKIEGSYSNVVGLPVELCKKMIKNINSRKNAFNAYLPRSLWEK